VIDADATVGMDLFDQVPLTMEHMDATVTSVAR